MRSGGKTLRLSVAFMRKGRKGDGKWFAGLFEEILSSACATASPPYTVPHFTQVFFFPFLSAIMVR